MELHGEVARGGQGALADPLTGGERLRARPVGQDLAVAAVAIDAAQIKGVLPLPLSALRSTLPVFQNPANKHKRCG